MTKSTIFVSASILALLFCNINCLVQVESSHLQQQHMYSDGRSGMGTFSAIIIAIIAGVLCFVGMIYFFKWRRENPGQSFSLGALFGRNNTGQVPYPQGGNYPAGQPYNQPYGGTALNQAGQPGYYNNPNYPNYPPL